MKKRSTRRKFLKQVSLSALAVPFASTGLTSCTLSPATEDLEVYLFSKHLQFLDIKTAAQTAGIKYYRCNWFKYFDDRPLEASLDYYQQKIQELGKLNKIHQIIGCYQNHSGVKIGASFWEVKKILATVDPAFFGAQYDIRHAVVEGGQSWTNGIRLLKEQIKTIVLKDFKWGQVNGKWQIIRVPIGEGMVDFTSYFKLLKSLGLQPPVSLHLEHPLGGAEKGRSEITVDKQVIFEAMKQDLERVRKLWREA